MTACFHLNQITWKATCTVLKCNRTLMVENILYCISTQLQFNIHIHLMCTNRAHVAFPKVSTCPLKPNNQAWHKCLNFHQWGPINSFFLVSLSKNQSLSFCWDIFCILLFVTSPFYTIYIHFASVSLQTNLSDVFTTDVVFTNTCPTFLLFTYPTGQLTLLFHPIFYLPSFPFSRKQMVLQNEWFNKGNKYIYLCLWL